MATWITNAEAACEALARVGFHFTPGELRVEAREERCVVHLPAGRLAWFASSENGVERLRTERRVLRLLEARCSFRAPRVIFESAAGDFDVRTMVPGVADPWRSYARAAASPSLAAQLGREVGAILAEQHTNIPASEAAAWLPPQPSWPEPAAWVHERLRIVVGDSRLRADADIVMQEYESVLVAPDDRCLVHSDLGLHNVAIDPDSDAVQGVFDYEDAAWADRHHDFRFLVFDLEQNALFDAALSVYEARTGRRIQRDRVWLYNAACALTFLAYRAGKDPEERSCGRTLAEDLRWSRFAISRAGRSGPP